jgi:CubicO group peptidase (beta-lactamase class C family)
VTPLEVYLRECIEQKIFTDAAVAVFKHNGDIVFHSEAGSNPVRTFDLASLTKALVTVPLALKFIPTLDIPVKKLWEKFPNADVRVLDLIQHKAGLKAWINFYVNNMDSVCSSFEDRALRIEQVMQRSDFFKSGTSELYSDLGYIFLGMILEHTQKTCLDKLWIEFLSEIGLKNNFPSFHAQKSISTGFCKLRERELNTGTVQDENCYVLGGVSGHAGLFGSAKDVYNYLSTLEKSAYMESILKKKCWRQADDYSSEVFKGGTGHMGFTGTAFWRNEKGTAVFLSNRVYYGRVSLAFKNVRRTVFQHCYDLVCA